MSEVRKRSVVTTRYLPKAGAYRQRHFVCPWRPWRLCVLCVKKREKFLEKKFTRRREGAENAEEEMKSEDKEKI